MTESEKIKLLKCLSDKSRLLIIKSLGKEDMYVERLAQRLGLSSATVSFHLKKLEEIGVVKSRRDQYYTVYSLCADALSFRLIDFIMATALSEREIEATSCSRFPLVSAVPVIN